MENHPFFEYSKNNNNTTFRVNILNIIPLDAMIFQLLLFEWDALQFFGQLSAS